MVVRIGEGASDSDPLGPASLPRASSGNGQGSVARASLANRAIPAIALTGAMIVQQGMQEEKL